jgi:hypothetical protein
LRTPEQMRALIEGAGFRVRAWDDVTADTTPTGPAVPEHSIQRLVMGDRLKTFAEPNRRNHDEQRLVSVQAVFDRL